jgi:hypothetical protein
MRSFVVLSYLWALRCRSDISTGSLSLDPDPLPPVALDTRYAAASKTRRTCSARYGIFVTGQVPWSEMWVWMQV